MTKRLVMNLGVRLDFYPTFQVKATSSRPAEIVNLEAPTDLRLMDFGAPRAQDNIYNPDWFNVGPRAGFAWTLDDAATTVIRGGSGVLFSPIMLALIQNNVADPLIGAATQYNRTELAARGLKWGNYADEIQAAVRQDRGGQKAIFSLIDPDLRAPYTIQSMINMQRSLGNAWMVEAGYVRTDGRNFPLSRPLANAFDRQTGARPNPALGTPSGVYVTSEQTMVYNALQTSVRRRFANDLDLGFHYTYSRGYAEQGGSLASNFVNSDYFVTQDFFDPFVDRNPLSQEARHRISVDAIYQVPSFIGWPRLDVSGPRRLANRRHRLHPHRRSAARHPALGHQQQQAGSDRRPAGARQLPGHPALPGPQSVQAGADVNGDHCDASPGDGQSWPDSRTRELDREPVADARASGWRRECGWRCAWMRSTRSTT